MERKDQNEKGKRRWKARKEEKEKQRVWSEIGKQKVGAEMDDREQEKSRWTVERHREGGLRGQEQGNKITKRHTGRKRTVKMMQPRGPRQQRGMGQVKGEGAKGNPSEERIRQGRSRVEKH